MAYEPDTSAQLDAWRGRSRGEVVARLRATPDQVTTVLAEHDGPWDGRVDGQWAPVDVVCHLLDPDRWAHDRQYLRNDIHEAAAALRRWRRQSGQLLSLLDDAQWGRTSIHPQLGRITLHDWTAIMAWHDGNHVSQLELAVRAR